MVCGERANTRRASWHELCLSPLSMCKVLSSLFSNSSWNASVCKVAMKCDVLMVYTGYLGDQIFRGAEYIESCPFLEPQRHWLAWILLDLIIGFINLGEALRYKPINQP